MQRQLLFVILVLTCCSTVALASNVTLNYNSTNQNSTMFAYSAYNGTNMAPPSILTPISQNMIDQSNNSGLDTLGDSINLDIGTGNTGIQMHQFNASLNTSWGVNNITWNWVGHNYGTSAESMSMWLWNYTGSSWYNCVPYFKGPDSYTDLYRSCTVNATDFVSNGHTNFLVWENTTSNYILETDYINLTVYYGVAASTLNLSISYPTNTTYAMNNVTINYTVSNSSAPIDKCWWNNNSGTNSTPGACNNITGIIWANGGHNVNIFANDTNGTNATASITFTTNVPFMSMSITSPANGSNSTSRYVPITYSITNLSYPISSCWYNNGTGGSNISLPGCGSITGINYTDGLHTITVYANDTAGNNASANVTFNIYPYIYCYQESANTTNQTGKDNCAGMDYSGSYTHTEGQFTGDIYIYYKKPTGAVEGKWQLKWADQGTQNYSINATNSLCWQQDPIQLHIQDYYGGYYTIACWIGYGYSTIAVSGSINGATNYNIADIGRAWDGDWGTGITYYSYNWYNWNTLNSLIWEEAMYWQMPVPGTVSVSITYPSQDYLWFNSSIGINYTLTNTSIATCKWTNDSGASNHTLTNCANVPSQSWPDTNTNTVTIYANDTNGLTTSATRIFGMDTLAPAMGTPIILSGTNYSNYFKGTLNLSSTAIDEGSEINTTMCKVNINNTGWISATYSSGKCKYLNYAPNANFNISFRAYDIAGNVNTSSTSSFIYDGTAPSISTPVVVGTAYGNYFKGSVNITTTVSDSGIGLNLSSCQISLNGGAYTSTGVTTNSTNCIYLNYNPTANFNVSFKINDNLSNTNTSSTVSYTYDNSAPSLNIVSPNQDGNWYTTMIPVNYDVSDSGVGISKCWWTGNGSTNYPVNCANITATWSQGLNTITIYTNDSLNNTNSSVRTFNIDTIYPQWNLNNTNITGVKKGQSVWLYVNMSDSGTGLNYSYFAIYNGSTWLFDSAVAQNNALSAISNITKTITAPRGTPISWYWVFNDSVGNTNQTSLFSAIVTNTAPVTGTPSLNSPLSMTSIVTCSVGSYSDTDNDAKATDYYQWYVDASRVLQDNTSTLNVTTYAHKGSTIYCRWLASDGFDNSTISSSNAVVVGNTAPSLKTDLSFSDYSALHKFNVSATFSDIDGASDFNSSSISSTSGSCQYLSNTTSGNDITLTYNCTGSLLATTYIKMNATDKSGASVSSSNLSHAYPNHAPTIATIYINNSNPGPTDDLACNITGATDPDSDSILVHYEWYNNSLAKGIDSSILLHGILSTGDQWYCEAWANDSVLNSSRIDSSPVNIGTGIVNPTILSVSATTANTGIATTIIPTNNNSWVNFSVNYTSAVSPLCYQSYVPINISLGNGWNHLSFITSFNSHNNITIPLVLGWNTWGYSSNKTMTIGDLSFLNASGSIINFTTEQSQCNISMMDIGTPSGYVPVDANSILVPFGAYYFYVMNEGCSIVLYDGSNLNDTIDISDVYIYNGTTKYTLSDAQDLGLIQNRFYCGYPYIFVPQDRSTLYPWDYCQFWTNADNLTLEYYDRYWNTNPACTTSSEIICNSSSWSYCSVPANQICNTTFGTTNTSCRYNATGNNNIGYHNYYAFVLDSDTGRSSAMSDQYVINHPANIPTVVYPAAGSVISNLSLNNITYSATDPDSDNTSYTVYISRDNITYAQYVPSYICYQETATQSTSCGGLSTGSYSTNSSITNITDGNWNTSSIFQNAFFIVNYTKPINANNATWQIKMTNYDDPTNYTIPYACWENESSGCLLEYCDPATLLDKKNNTISLKVVTQWQYYGYSLEIDCLADDGWDLIADVSPNSPFIFYEEGMYWNMNSSNMSSQGIYYIKAKSIDAWGYGYNANSSVTNFTLDLGPTFVNDLVNQTVTHNLQNLSYDVNCTSSLGYNITYYINDSNLSINSTTGIINDSPTIYDVGTKTVMITCGDGYVNSSEVFNYSVLNTVPILDTIAFYPVNNLGDQDVNLNITYHDVENDNITANIKWYYGATAGTEIYMAAWENKLVIGKGNLSNGYYIRANVILSDGLLNSSVTSNEMQIGDTINPSVNQIWVSGLSFVLNQQVTLYANVTDNVAVNYVDFDYNEPDVHEVLLHQTIGVGNIYSKNIQFTKVGTYTLNYVKAYDTSGNTNQTSSGIQITVTAGNSSGGGSGGGTTIYNNQTFNLSKGLADLGICNHNGICESNETISNCADDCHVDLSTLFCTPFFQCGNWNQTWFITILAWFLLVVAIVGYFMMQNNKYLKRKSI